MTGMLIKGSSPIGMLLKSMLLQLSWRWTLLRRDPRRTASPSPTKRVARTPYKRLGSVTNELFKLTLNNFILLFSELLSSSRARLRLRCYFEVSRMKNISEIVNAVFSTIIYLPTCRSVIIRSKSAISQST